MNIIITKNQKIDENLKNLLKNSKINLEIDLSEYLTKILLINETPYLSSCFNLDLLDYLYTNSIKIIFRNCASMYDNNIYNYVFKDETFRKIISKLTYPNNLMFDNNNLIEYLIKLNNINNQEINFPIRYIFNMNLDKYLENDLNKLKNLSRDESMINNYIIAYLLKKIKKYIDCNKFKILLCKILIENNNYSIQANKILEKIFFETKWDNNNILKMNIFNRLLDYNNGIKEYHKIEQLYLYILK